MEGSNQRCVRYPRKNLAIHVHKKIEAPPTAWADEQEADGYMPKPINAEAMLPCVQWRDAKEFVNDCKDLVKLPLCVWLGK